MRIAMVCRPLSDSRLRLAAQLGVSDIVATVPDVPLEPQPTQGPPVPVETFLALRRRVESFGLRLAVIEGYQLSNRITLGLPGWEEDLAGLTTTIGNMGAAGIPIYCYNFMAVFNWLRTDTAMPSRGGALVSGYDHSRMQDAPLTHAGRVSEERMWQNFERFFAQALPAAEAAGVTLALHPDDPPISPLRGLARIMRSVDAFRRVMALASSPHNAITFCQGSFASMGDEDLPALIREFGGQGKIAFVHFRDVQGKVPVFQESFHDDGKSDMAAIMRTYRAVGYSGPMRPDHAPTLEGERNDDPGYMMLGRLFAIGYMRGLWEASAGAESDQ